MDGTGIGKMMVDGRGGRGGGVNESGVGGRHKDTQCWLLVCSCPISSCRLGCGELLGCKADSQGPFRWGAQSCFDPVSKNFHPFPTTWALFASWC